MKRAASMVVAGVILLAMALPARAATTTVQMTDTFTFDPTPVSVALGDTVEWDNVTQVINHTATSNTGFFNTGTVTPGSSASKLFKFGGSFPYYCKFHGAPGSGMHGAVKVPDQWLNTGTQHPGDVQRIRVASVAAPDGLAFDVQMRTTGGDWRAFKVKETAAVVKFTPDAAGEYQFRSRLHRLSNNKVSRFSPRVFVEISS